jgi:hypothetical protein
MEEIPNLPVPVPQIPRGALWICLLVPPVATLVINMTIGFATKNDADLSLLVPPMMLLVIIGFCVWFHSLVRRRYLGRSLVFLNSSYFLGQIIVCLALWIGSCVAFFPPLRF